MKACAGLHNTCRGTCAHTLAHSGIHTSNLIVVSPSCPAVSYQISHQCQKDMVPPLASIPVRQVLLNPALDGPHEERGMVCTPNCVQVRQVQGESYMSKNMTRNQVHATNCTQYRYAQAGGQDCSYTEYAGQGCVLECTDVCSTNNKKVSAPVILTTGHLNRDTDTHIAGHC
jgi:hypothetical protein